MPRPYRLGQRQAIVDQTRARIVEAARAVLVSADSSAGFSMDAVARQADVARMTVYHQFGSKAGLLEALCDSLAVGGGMEHLASAFMVPRLEDALDRFVATFSRFWSADRPVIRRLNAFAAFDPDLRQVMQARNERRRHGLRALIERHCAQMSQSERDEIVSQLFALTSFEYFDLLAGPDRDPEEVAPQVAQIAQKIVDRQQG
jgi:AcrR family transcriptional regulator